VSADDPHGRQYRDPIRDGRNGVRDKDAVVHQMFRPLNHISA
jgi:hypothetical protein